MTDTNTRAALTELIEAVEAAHTDLFRQCCSNPIKNAWGKEVSVLKLNEAAELASRFKSVHAAAPSLPAGDGLTDEQRDTLVAISDAIAGQDYPYAQAMLRTLLAAPRQPEQKTVPFFSVYRGYIEHHISPTGVDEVDSEIGLAAARLAMEAARMLNGDAAPRQPGEVGAGVQTQDALRWIMRQAESAKEPCSDNPESPAAIRNGKLAGIATAAAQALGLVRGPSYAASAQQDERGAFELHYGRTEREEILLLRKDVQQLNARNDELSHELVTTRAAQQVQADAGAVAEVAAGNLGNRLMWHTEDAKMQTPVGTLLYTNPASESDKRDAALHEAMCAITAAKVSHAKAAGESVDAPDCDIQTGINLAWEAVGNLRAAMSREQSGGGE